MPKASLYFSKLPENEANCPYRLGSTDLLNRVFINFGNILKCHPNYNITYIYIIYTLIKPNHTFDNRKLKYTKSGVKFFTRPKMPFYRFTPRLSHAKTKFVKGDYQ
mmetsp:Transcript_22281/g.28503  ORF Transcript_22281/g.28503 Transcript_22281/m.28503 type:complete len:106 (+) Transcript_22281:251-568(+)